MKRAKAHELGACDVSLHQSGFSKPTGCWDGETGLINPGAG